MQHLKRLHNERIFETMNKKTTISVIVIILILISIAYSTITEANMSEEERLIEEINFASDPSKNINELYFFDKYDPDLYFCLGTTISDEIYVGYEQIKNFGTTINGSESLYLSASALFSKNYYCFEKTQEEGKFYFGFIRDDSINSVNINGQNIVVKHFNYPNNSEKNFGFWYIKTDWNYSIKDFSYNESQTL